MQYLETIITVLTSVLIAATGWYIVHYFTMLRDRKNKQKEMRLQALLKAFRLLFSSMEKAYNEIPPYKYAPHLKKAYAEIQLFGNIEINKRMKELYDEIRDALDPQKSQTGVSFSIVQELRDAIRRELELEENQFDISFPLILRKFGAAKHKLSQRCP